MKTLTMLVVPFSLLAVLIIARPASASTTADCQALLSVLSADTAAATYLRGDLGLKTQAQLLQHLDKTSAELDANDVRDALKQMGNFSTTLDRATSAGKIDATNAAALQVEADGVVSCIQQIQ
jgi:hypothetical protein